MYERALACSFGLVSNETFLEAKHSYCLVVSALSSVAGTNAAALLMLKTKLHFTTYIIIFLSVSDFH
jgi:hypothetical protein